MFKVATGLGSLGVAVGLAATFALTASAAPPEGTTAQPPAPAVDDLPNPAENKRRELREAAIKEVLAGRAKVQDIAGSKVVKLGKTAPSAAAPAEDQYVELAREKTDKIFVVLAEFGNERAPGYPDQDTDPKTPGPTTFNGPLHNAIPAPDRTKDNSTVWQPDYSRDHYQQLYFGTGPETESVKTYYERQSSGRYTVDGQVTDWVKVRYNEARYGRSNGYPCAGNVCSNTWDLIKDAIDTWVADQHAKGRTDEQIKADLASYDQWDRNDYDHDGNFNEPDGYIDHFQIVHAGGDQADGDPQQGEDAIWSHRWKAFQNTGQGPAGNKDGGTQIGTTGLWVADYTIQPENGGISVFAHEYAHDLGLPDEYDTAASVDTAVNWWTLMSQSRTSAATDQGIGTRAADLGAWDKLQLGWLDYEIAVAGQNKTLDLGPHEGNTAKAQGLVVVLPQKTVTTPLGAPAAGTKQWCSGTRRRLRGDADARRSRCPPAPATLSFQARWNIEDCGPDACDYAYVEVDDGTRLQGDPGLDHQARRGQRDRRGQRRLQAGDVRPVGLRQQDRLAALPLQDRHGAAGQRRRGGPARHLPRRDQADQRDADRVHRRRRERRQRLGGDRLQHRRRDVVEALRPLLHRLEPDVHRVRPLPADRAVQLRLPGPAGLGRALPVPEWPAGLLLGHLVLRQQRERPSGPGRDPADRRQPVGDLPARRQAVARARPDL